jgi:hypothetical protein
MMIDALSSPPATVNAVATGGLAGQSTASIVTGQRDPAGADLAGRIPWHSEQL